jgi:hypothetical protein
MINTIIVQETPRRPVADGEPWPADQLPAKFRKLASMMDGA